MKKGIRLIAAMIALAMLATFIGCTAAPAPTPAPAAPAPAATPAPAAPAAAATPAPAAPAPAVATPAPAAAATPAPAAPVANKYAEHVKISWVPQNDHEIPADADTKLALEKMFNWTLDVIYLDRNNEVQLLNTRLAAGEIPDVIRTGSDARYKEFVAQGILKELKEDEIKQYAPTMYQKMIDLFKDFGPNVFETIQVDGKLYGFPIGNLNGTYHSLPIWRDDWLKKMGGDGTAPTKWEDMLAAWKYFTENDPDGDGQKNTYAMSNTGMNYLRGAAFGGDAFDLMETDASGKLVPNVLLDGKYKLYVETMADLYKQGLIDPEFITGENQGQYWAKSVTFINGKIGFACPGSYYHTNGPLYEGQKNPSTNYEPFLELNPNGSYTHGKTVVGPTGLSFAPGGAANPGNKVVIGKNIDPKAYVRFLEFHEAMFTDYEVYRLVVDGIKDIRYKDVVLPDGRVAYQNFTDDEMKAAGHPNAGKGLYTNGFGFLAEDCWDFLKKRDIALYDYADKTAVLSALGGEKRINLMWQSVPKTATQKNDINKLRDQNFQLFVTGQRPMSDWDKYIKELNDAGMQAWLDECNEVFLAK